MGVMFDEVIGDVENPRKQHHPLPLENDGWKMFFLLKWYLFRGHVNFQGGNLLVFVG